MAIANGCFTMKHFSSLCKRAAHVKHIKPKIENGKEEEKMRHKHTNLTVRIAWRFVFWMFHTLLWPIVPLANVWELLCENGCFFEHWPIGLCLRCQVLTTHLRLLVLVNNSIRKFSCCAMPLIFGSL